MDPLTLSLLLIGGGAGLAQGVGQAVSNRQQAKLNREELDQLLHARATGNLGLSGAQEQAIYNRTVQPIQRSATFMQHRAEQAQAAAGGGLGGVQQAQLRREQASQIGQAQQQAAAAIQSADAQERQRQRNEIEQRLALKTALNRDALNQILGGAAQVAIPLGMMAGQPPGTSQMTGAFGEPKASVKAEDAAAAVPEVAAKTAPDMAAASMIRSLAPTLGAAGAGPAASPALAAAFAQALTGPELGKMAEFKAQNPEAYERMIEELFGAKPTATEP